MATSVLCKELLVKVGYGSVACRLWGDNVPSTEKFLAVHGWQDNAGSFDPLLKHFLTKDRCVACIDLPGHGLSSHLPRGVPYSPASDLQGVRSVAKHLGWTNVNLIGHSMGSMRAQGYALCWPDEVKSIVCLDGAIVPLKVEMKDPFESFGKQVDSFLKYNTENPYHGKPREHTWKELAERWMAAQPGLTDDDFTVLMKRGSVQLDNGSYIYTRDPSLNTRTNAVLAHTADILVESMGRLKDTPQLIVSSDLVFSHEQFKRLIWRMAEAYPDQIEILEFDGTHHFHMQQPGEVTRIINDFLLKHSMQKLSNL